MGMMSGMISGFMSAGGGGMMGGAGGDAAGATDAGSTLSSAGAGAASGAADASLGDAGSTLSAAGVGATQGAADASGPTTGQIAGSALQKMGSSMQSQNKSAQGNGNLYSAVFASSPTNTISQSPLVPQPMAQMQTPQAMNQPLPITQMQPRTQLPAPPPSPQPMQLGAMSDHNSKKNIVDGNKELDAFLQKIYNNVTNKRTK